MSLITFTSASGSPGCTTIAMASALTWPRPVTLVEADPTGGSGILAGYFKGVVDHPGLIDLVMAQRQGDLPGALPKVLLPVPGTHARVLVGSKAHEQSVGLADLWHPLVGALRDLEVTGQDVIVDAGRLGLESAPLPLVLGADVTVLLTRTSLPALAAARSWATALKKHSTGVVGCVLVGEGRPYRAGEVQRVLGIPCFGSVAWSPRDARVFSEGEPYPRRGWFGDEDAHRRRFGQAPWNRSIVALGESLRGRAAAASEAVDVMAMSGGES